VGPFFDEAPQTLQYTLTPPAGAFETQTLSGTASFDGADVAVTGVKTLQRAPITRPGTGDRRDRGKGKGQGTRDNACLAEAGREAVWRRRACCAEAGARPFGGGGLLRRSRPRSMLVETVPNVRYQVVR